MISNEKQTMFQKEIELETLMNQNSFEKIYENYPNLVYILDGLDTFIKDLSHDFNFDQNHLNSNSLIDFKYKNDIKTLYLIVTKYTSFLRNSNIQNLNNHILLIDQNEKEEIIFILTFNKKLMELIVKFYKVITNLINNNIVPSLSEKYEINYIYETAIKSCFENYESIFNTFTEKVIIFKNKIKT